MKYDQTLHELWFDAPHKELERFSYKPIGLISSLVEGFFVIENTNDFESPTLILPDLSPHFIIYQFKNKGQEKARISLIGPRTKAIKIDHHRRIKTMIFRLKPGSLSFIMKDSIESMKDYSVDVGYLWPQLKTQLIEILNFFPSEQIPISIIGVINNWLARHITSKASFQNVTNAFLLNLRLNEGVYTIKNIAKEIGFSERYLRKATLFTLGVNPKMAIRIERLRQSLIQKQFSVHNRWTDVAYGSGYYDQSHMIDEYQCLLKYSPSQLFE